MQVKKGMLCLSLLHHCHPTVRLSHAEGTQHSWVAEKCWAGCSLEEALIVRRFGELGTAHCSVLRVVVTCSDFI